MTANLGPVSMTGPFYVTITGQSPYEVYQTLQFAQRYITGVFGPGSDAFLNVQASGIFSQSDMQARILVAARDYLDRQTWQGTPTYQVGPNANATILEWPRSNVVDLNGNQIDQTAVPIPMIRAYYEMAMAIALDPTAYTARDNGSNIKDIKAGPVDISYFKPTTGYLNGAAKMPQNVQDLVGYLLGSATQRGGIVTGTVDPNTGSNAESQFNDDRTYRRSWGF